MVPILLHHGILGYDRIRLGPVEWAYFGGGIERALAGRGHAVRCARVSRTGSIETRAHQLKTHLQAFLEEQGRPGQRAIILAHSMGGLDARYMVARLGMAPHVAAIVTLSTPHRGSSYADWLLRNIDRPKVQWLLERMKLGLEGARDLTVRSMARFNEQVPDHPEVAYFSVSAARPWHRVPAYLLHSHRIVTRNEGANDGIVSVASATWGTHLETWPADHLHVINRRLVVEFRQKTGNVRPRYLRLLDQLQQHGIVTTPNLPPTGEAPTLGVETRHP